MGKAIGYTCLAAAAGVTAHVLYNMEEDERKEAVKSVVGFFGHCLASAFGAALGQNAADSLFK